VLYRTVINATEFMPTPIPATGTNSLRVAILRVSKRWANYFIRFNSIPYTSGEMK